MLAKILRPNCVLRRLFTEPNSLRPDQTRARVTEQAEDLLTQVFDSILTRAIDFPRVAIPNEDHLLLLRRRR